MSKKAVLLRIAVDRGLNRKDSLASKSYRSKLSLSQVHDANLVGIGYGVKETLGKITGDLAVRIYVKKKVPLADLPRTQRIPPLVEGAITDVVAIGRPRFHARPTYPGAGISHFQGKAGSLGCVVGKPGNDGWFILSACHVLALAGAAQIGDLIVEPPTSAAASSRLAILTDFEPLQADNHQNRFDAAIARLDQISDVTDNIPTIGQPRWPLMEPLLYQSVRKHGATTLHTLGVVKDTQVQDFIISDGQSYTFSDVILVSGAGGPFSKGGDSGALVVDAMTQRAVGLIIGGSSRGTLVSPLKGVFRRFDLKPPEPVPLI